MPGTNFSDTERFRIVSVDVETSGLDPKRHALLSIGVVVPAADAEFYKEVKHDELLVSPSAMAINQIPIEGVDIDHEDRLELADLDNSLHWFLTKHAYKRGGNRLIMLAKNAAFDYAWVKEHLPKTAKLFSYRLLDLTPLGFLNDIKGDLPLGITKKRVEDLVDNDNPHHALDDARENVEALYQYTGVKLNDTE